MTPKYTTGDDVQGTLWDADRQYTLRSWTGRPFTGHRHRHERVENRIIVEYDHGVGAEIRWQVRSEDTDKIPDHWVTIERIELRDYGARHFRSPKRRWFR